MKATDRQSEINFISQVTKKMSLHISLLILTLERKNYTTMAQSNNVVYSRVYVTAGEALFTFQK